MTRMTPMPLTRTVSHCTPAERERRKRKVEDKQHERSIDEAERDAGGVGSPGGDKSAIGPMMVAHRRSSGGGQIQQPRQARPGRV